MSRYYYNYTTILTLLLYIIMLYKIVDAPKAKNMNAR